MSFTRRALLGALPLWQASRLLRGQQVQNPPAQNSQAQTTKPDENPTFSAGVKVVNVFATVRNVKGEIVTDLTKDDFVLDEDGHPQTIRYFSRESDLPLTVGLLVDTSGSTRRVLPDERMASYKFLEQTLRVKDLAFLIHFDFEVELLQDLTSSKPRLEKALDQLETGDGGGLRRRQQGGGGGYPNGGGGQRHGGTCLYDSVLLASDEILKKQAGRKAIILMTDGEDNGSKVTLSRAVEAAERADTLVYSILFQDPDANYMPGGFGMGRRRGMGGPPMGRSDRPDGKKILQQISRETGGRFFEVSHKMPINKVFESIEEELRSQYSLGYTPDRTDSNGEYRHIHLAAKQKNLIVQTREGYYPT
jgi:VWFA-related protein